MFQNIFLEPEQENLLMSLVEAARNAQPNVRQPFVFYNFEPVGDIVHPGLQASYMKAYISDIEQLVREELLLPLERSSSGVTFTVTPKGAKYYEYLKTRMGQPLQRVEQEIRSYLGSDEFKQKYREALERWSSAEGLLWSADTDKQLTTIGHLCREAVQQFATRLVEEFQPENVNANKASDVARIKAVLDTCRSRLASTEYAFLDALLPYWGTVSDLIQRQEHGGQKEGHPVVWEDARRVVFQTANLMFEFDRSLHRKPV